MAALFETIDLDNARAMAGRANDLMTKLGVAPTPRNYEIWFAHVSSAKPALSTALQTHFDAGHAWTEAAAEDFYKRFFTPEGRNDQFKDIGRELESELAGAINALAQAGQQTSSYGKALELVGGQIEKGLDAAALRAVVTQLASATRAMHARTVTLEKELETASREVKGLHAKVEAIRQEAFTDALTNLPNRKAFDMKLEQAAKAALENGTELCLVMGDVDHFKTFNDTWGHQTGDQVLKLVAHAFAENIKGRDTAARFGGEEFVVILPMTGMNQGRHVAEQIRTAIAAKKVMKRQSSESLGSVTMSFGVATYRMGENLEDLIQRADASLYTAKRCGRNMVVTETQVNPADLEMAAQKRTQKAA